MYEIKSANLVGEEVTVARLDVNPARIVDNYINNEPYTENTAPNVYNTVQFAMPVNSFSFKIDVPTSNIPIATSLAVTSANPPDTVPSGAIELSTMQYSSSTIQLTIPNNSALFFVRSSVSRYQLSWYNNHSGSSRTVEYTDPMYYIIISTTTGYNLSLYGTDGVLSGMLLLSMRDIASNDNYSNETYISTKCLLLSLPDDI